MVRKEDGITERKKERGESLRMREKEKGRQGTMDKN